MVGACLSVDIICPNLFSRKSHVRLINLTPFDINVGALNVKSGSSLDTSSYSAYNGNVKLFSTKDSILVIERNVGIKNGISYEFNLPVTVPYVGDIILQIQEIGTPTDSILKMSVRSGSNASVLKPVVKPWSRNSRDRNSATFSDGTHTFIVTYTSFFTGSEDDMWYTIDYIDETNYRVEPVGDDGINLFFYNLYMRGPLNVFQNGQMQRAKIIPQEITGKFDLLGFCEAFEADARTELLNGLKKYGYSYSTEIVGSGGVMNGGVIVVSKWPIIKHKVHIFDACAKVDCVSKKGVIYAAIDKNGKKYHIFATHTNASYDTKDDPTRAIRLKQFKEVHVFIKAQKIPKSEPVIIMGDLNVDMLSNPAEYQEMLHALNASHPPLTGFKYSWDPVTNKLASQTDLSLRQLLDYILYSNTHLKPTKSFDKILYFKSHSDWFAKQDLLNRFFDRNTGAVHTTLFDLSDHYPVYGQFIFSGY